MKPRSKKRPVRRSTKRKAQRKASVPQARYEAAYQGFFDRSWLPAATQDARFDFDSSTRMELLRRSRYWEANNGIVNRLCDVFEQYTTGPDGLRVIPNVPDDEDWNQAASKWWNDFCKWPAVDNGLTMGVLQGLMARTWFVDGECFIYKTFSPDSGRPRIQLIEGHRVGTPPEMRSSEGRSIIDGIEFNTDANGQPIGRPKRYWLRTDSISFYSGQWQSGRGQSWAPVEGNRMLHLFEPSRPGMVHGPPILYPVMNDLHDLDDLQFLEMKAAKDAAEKSTIVTNKTGEASTTSSRAVRWKIQSQDKDGNPIQKTPPPLMYETTVGGRTIYVSNGERVDQFQTNRPSVATKEYWDYLVRKICAGVGISSLLVLPFSLQGTVTRADLDAAAAFFRSRSTLIAAIMREIYVWAMSWAVKYDRQLDGAPAEWWHCTIRPPRSVVVDLGRNSWAVTQELEAGIRSIQDVCAEMGHDWRHVLRQRAIEAKYKKELAKEFGIRPEEIILPSQSAKGTGNDQPTSQTTQTKPEPEGDKTPKAAESALTAAVL